MNGKTDLTPRRKSPRTMEKAETGGKRMIPGMVADTLALVAKKETPSEARPLRIVMLDDVEGPLRSTEMVIRSWFKNATVLKFQNGDEALRELAREEPDLLVTDVCHPGPSGYEMLRLFAAKRVKFPILIISATATQGQVSQAAGSGLTVGFLQKP